MKRFMLRPVLMCTLICFAAGCGVETGGSDDNGNGSDPGSIWHVDAGADVSGDGTAWNTAFKTLQKALAAAASGDEIWVALGTYVPTATADRDISFELIPGVALYGGFYGDETERAERNPSLYTTILSGDLSGDDTSGGDNSENSYHVISGADGALLDGFVIQGGNADGPVVSDPDITVQLTNRMGGGLVCGQNSAVTVSNCTFQSNEAHMGGAAAVALCGGIIRDCTFTSNNVSMKGETSPGAGGGAVFWYAENAVDADIENCTFSGNGSDTTGAASGGGGSVYITGPVTCTVTDCTFSSNLTSGIEGEGGALYADSGADVTLYDTVFLSNSSGSDGGAVSVKTAALDAIRCTFSSNTADGEGGAVVCRNGFFSAERCEFSGNTVDGTAACVRGGAVALEGSAGAAGFSAWNCVFSNNQADGTSSVNDSYGGGVHAWENCTVGCYFSTFSGNTADHGGALRLGSSSDGCILGVNSCILWNDTGNISDDEISDDPGGSTSVNYSDIKGGWPLGTGNMNADPNFVGGGDLHIQGGPCVNTGDESKNPEMDIEGTVRDTWPDMGAYEFSG